MTNKLLTINNEFKLSNHSYEFLKKIALERAGIVINDDKKNNIYNRLVKRLRSLHLEDFQSYCELLSKDENEVSTFINLLTNLHTTFFREAHHFDYVAKTYIPELLKYKNKIRIWSAGCSTGEEAYSLAIALYEMIQNIDNYDIKILATDINQHALKVAKTGIYNYHEIASLSIERQRTWFDSHSTPNTVEIDEKLKKLIIFKQLNLLEPWPMHGKFDIVFCRNTIIYFQHHISLQLINRFYHILELGGILILGHSEGGYIDSRLYEPVRGEVTIYQKLDKGPA